MTEARAIIGVHDGFDENQRVVWRAEGVLQVLDGFDDERSCPGVATEHLRQIGIGPVGDVVVRLGLYRDSRVRSCIRRC